MIIHTDIFNFAGYVYSIKKLIFKSIISKMNYSDVFIRFSDQLESDNLIPQVQKISPPRHINEVIHSTYEIISGNIGFKRNDYNYAAFDKMWKLLYNRVTYHINKDMYARKMNNGIFADMISGDSNLYLLIDYVLKFFRYYFRFIDHIGYINSFNYSFIDQRIDYISFVIRYILFYYPGLNDTTVNLCVEMMRAYQYQIWHAFASRKKINETGQNLFFFDSKLPDAARLRDVKHIILKYYDALYETQDALKPIPKYLYECVYNIDWETAIFNDVHITVYNKTTLNRDSKIVFKLDDEKMIYTNAKLLQYANIYMMKFAPIATCIMQTKTAEQAEFIVNKFQEYKKICTNIMCKHENIVGEFSELNNMCRGDKNFIKCSSYRSESYDKYKYYLDTIREKIRKRDLKRKNRDNDQLIKRKKIENDVRE